MIKSLYTHFQEWSNGGQVWLLSDPHFEDDDTKLMNPNWLDPYRHLDYLRKTIHKNDTLVCLGDCGNIDYFKQINCRKKILIKGNHDDKGNNFYQRQHIEETYDGADFDKQTLRTYLEKKYPYCNINIVELTVPVHQFFVDIDTKLFDEVYSGPLFISDKILLSHEPINGLSFCVNIHGHCHNQKGTIGYLDDSGCKHINLASDVVNFKIFDLNEFIKKGICSKIDNIHRITIDRASANPIHKKDKSDC